MASDQLASRAVDFQATAEAYYSIAVEKVKDVVSSLPDDIRPGPDLYGVPWEPVIISSLVGLVTMLLFSCRCYSSVKSRMYRSRERWMAEQVAQLLDEKCKVLETLSTCQQEYDELETSLRDSGVLAQTQKTEHLEGKTRQLEHAKRELERDLDQLKDQLDQQREHRLEQERRIAALEESMKTCEEETKDLQSQEEQAQTTLKVYSMNSDRLQRNLETAGEENTLQQESNAQLRQQVEGWAERVSELEEEMRRCEVAYSGMVQDVANKDERIMSLTDRLLRMKAWDSDLEEERGEEGGEETSNGTAGKGEENGRGDESQGHLQKVQKLIYAAKLNADLKSVDEDKDRTFAKLNDEVKAKEELEVSIKELENEKLSLQSDSENYSDQVQRLQQKLNIMTEMYQENELKLHRLLTVEEKERLQKEEKLNKADKNIALAMEELQNYRHRAEEMEEELEKTKQSYQTQISAHEKKAHNNWLAARAADRELSDTRRENALLRQKLTDTQFKMDALDKDPYALESLARPLPFRAERSPYGPSPLGRPASETRAFLSPPTLMEGPPARLSPRVEPPGGYGDMERSGGPHSDSGSISPTWERERRGPPPGPLGPLGPPGYMFPEPGGPMYRRPLPPPGPMGILPPPGSLPLGPPLPHPRGLPPPGPPGRPHPADMADGSFRENSLGPGEQDHRESGPSDRRTPPEADPRMGGAPPPGPPMGPMDGPFPRRAPYGPPPPDFYPPRGPGGPPMMPMWAPPPPGMMFPPRFPPGGPPHPHMPSYGPPMRPPPPDDLPPPSMGPRPHSQSPEEHTPSPQDVI
ncbi:melanoma inhibitory activity protein 2 isoform X3 [Thunnus maccoyii]|uniref:melanoma inhibitory activity protein 2 isoform X3 n=1 Tax=Thunnus maccoyii TaxID=8240 RepID=UPI001C4BCA17|nr:melanoma inhibitory activity protein 2 isoform X3 [Thunnus maccoyii]